MIYDIKCIKDRGKLVIILHTYCNQLDHLSLFYYSPYCCQSHCFPFQW